MTLLKIAPTKAEKDEQKQWEKKKETLAGEPTLEHSKGYESKRNEDLFIGGPLDGHTTSHQPNGPEQDWDPGRNWADYYFRDEMRLNNIDRKIEGYHVYSSARALQYTLVEDGAKQHRDHKRLPQLNLGTRGPLHRKCYYYCGFMETGLLVADKIFPSDFRGILSI